MRTPTFIASACLALAALSAAGAWAQMRISPDEMVMTAHPFDPLPPTLTFRSQTSLVQVEAVVRGADGQPARGLTQADFEVSDQGRAQAITGFSVETPAALAAPAADAPAPGADASGAPEVAPPPRFVGFFIDDINTGPPGLARANQAIAAALRRGLQPGEQVAVFTASGQVTVNFTANSNAAMVAASHIVHFPMWQDFKARVTLQALRGVLGLYARQQGDRSLEFLSAGFNATQDDDELHKMIGTAQHAGVVINAVDLRGLVVGGVHTTLAQRQAGTDALNEASEETGGEFVENTNDIRGAVARLARGPEVAYLLSFSPSKLDADGSFHRLSVKVTAPGHFTIQARNGYFAPDRPGRISEFAGLQEVLSHEATTADMRSQIPVTLTIEPGPLENGQSGIHIVADLKTRGLPFQKKADRSIEQISFAAVLTDAQGHYVNGQQGEMNLRLSDATRDALNKAGLKTGMALEAPPGAYQLREVVQESVKGQTTTLTQQVVVP